MNPIVFSWDPTRDGARPSDSPICSFFENRRNGVFVDIGANHPIKNSETWPLEQQGWSGLLVEPNPELCELLRRHRPGSRVFQIAACAPGKEGEAELHLANDDGKSSLNPEWDHLMTGKTVRVATRTINSVLVEASVHHIDFLSLDVEGMELEVLRGIDLVRYAPALILIEDHFYNHDKHRYLRNCGYKLVKRTGYNNWYVPNAENVSLQSMTGLVERTLLRKKMWLNLPFNRIRYRLKMRKSRSRQSS